MAVKLTVLWKGNTSAGAASRALADVVASNVVQGVIHKSGRALAVTIEREELERLLAERPGGARSALHAVKEAYAEISLMREQGVTWAEIAELLGRNGAVGRDGKPFSAATIRAAFFLVGAEIRQGQLMDEAGDGTGDSITVEEAVADLERAGPLGDMVAIVGDLPEETDLADPAEEAADNGPEITESVTAAPPAVAPADGDRASDEDPTGAPVEVPPEVRVGDVDRDGAEPAAAALCESAPEGLPDGTASAEPASEEPTSEEPVSEEPVSEEPVAEEPTWEEPTIEAEDDAPPAVQPPPLSEPVMPLPATGRLRDDMLLLRPAQAPLPPVRRGIEPEPTKGAGGAGRPDQPDQPAEAEARGTREEPAGAPPANAGPGVRPAAAAAAASSWLQPLPSKAATATVSASSVGKRVTPEAALSLDWTRRVDSSP